MRQIICPPELLSAAEASGFSPAVRAGDFIYFTGAVGVMPDGTMPQDAKRQTRTALEKVLKILVHVNASASDLVEITSYHVDIRAHFAVIREEVQRCLGEPLPAWTALGVNELRRPGALVEFRCVAYHPEREASRHYEC